MTDEQKPGQSEAVAWLYDGPDGEHYIREHRDVSYNWLVRNGWTETPLYAHPSPAPASDWFAGDVDCDGNELVTIRADELQRLKDEREKFMWQVRDTCARAEKAEAALAAPASDEAIAPASDEAKAKAVAIDAQTIWRDAYYATYGCEPTHHVSAYKNAHAVIEKGIRAALAAATPMIRAQARDGHP